MCSNKVVTASNERLVKSLFEDTFDSTKESLAKAYSLMDAFVKYAKGVDALVKQAQVDDELDLDSKTEESDYDLDLHSVPEDEDLDLDTDSLMDLDLDNLPGDSEEFESDFTTEDMFEGDDTEVDEETSEGELSSDLDEELSLTDSDENAAMLKANKDALKTMEVDAGDQVQVVASLKTKKDRMVARAKLAADTMKMKVSPLLHDAHPKGSHKVKFDESASDGLDVVEDLEDQHDAMMKLVNAPVKVRKEAEMIHKLISEGSLSVEDLDDLVARGADKETIAYYKKYYGEVDGGSEFASELLKEHAKAEVQETLEREKLKLARAYALAYEMADKGLIVSDMKAVASKVDELMKINDEGFDSLKSVIAAHKPVTKLASRVPNVGQIETFASREVAPAGDDFVTQLSQALLNSKRKAF
jgi:hypothetical protein